MDIVSLAGIEQFDKVKAIYLVNYSIVEPLPLLAFDTLKYAALMGNLELDCSAVDKLSDFDLIKPEHCQ